MKTGQLDVPISLELAREIASVLDGDRNSHIAVTHCGTRWMQNGLAQAFDRVLEQTGLKGWSVWLRAGIPVHVVQRMVRHVHLSTTRRFGWLGSRNGLK